MTPREIVERTLVRSVLNGMPEEHASAADAVILALRESGVLVESAEAKLLGLLKGEFSSLTIGFNDDCACNYTSVAQWVDEDNLQDGAELWVSPEERVRAIENNSMWTLQWYPQTPVGFHKSAASSLGALLDSLPSPPLPKTEG
jgi:hypothetical protein